MDKAAILAVDDDDGVRNALARDLRREYGRDYRILRASSGRAALELLRDMKLRGAPVALFVVDQRMPELTGIEFLREAVRLYPDAGRVLLTAYADTDVAIRAINEVRLDHYLTKPWDPPEERLYPVLTDLLEEWRTHSAPAFDGLRVVGHRWSPEGHRIRDFLARNLVPYEWLDMDASPEAVELVELAGVEPSALPLVVFPDGTSAARPDPQEIARRIGLRTRAEATYYDLVIVGAGPAGLAAAVYGASEGLSTLVVEREAPGGQAGMSASIENYLGFPVGLSGADLARRAVSQARRFGAELLTPVEATNLRLEGDYRVVELSNGAEVACRALLVATGVSYDRLDVPGAERLTGAGVYYGAAITEAIAVRDEDICIVGGGNSAGQAAMYLARYARTVTLLVRGGSLATTMSSYLIAQLEGTENVRIRTRVNVLKLHGEGRLEAITIRDAAAADPERLPTHALFVFIGALAKTAWLDGVVECDARGYILTGPDVMREGKRPQGWTAPRDPFWLESSVPGVFVAGDVRFRSIKRVASAVGEGAMAVQFVHKHLTGSRLFAPPARRERGGGPRADALATVS